MKKIIIGRNGFVARRIIGALQGEEYILTSSSSDCTDNTVRLELDKAEQFNYSVINEGDMVIMAAAVSSPDICKNNHELAHGINVKGTSFFMDKCLELGAKVLFFSSDTVYGGTDGGYVDENSPLNPIGEYGIMKAEVEERFKVKTNFKSFRLSYVFAENDKFASYLKSCIGGEAEIFDPFDRSVIYINDLVSAVLNIGQMWDSVKTSAVNICGPQLVSRKDMAMSFQKIFPEFRYRVTVPDDSFFTARPKVINMKSVFLKDILGRDPLNIEAAMREEFKGEKK